MKVGDKVEVLDDAISGKVLSIKLDKVVIMTADGFELEFFENELIVIDYSISKRNFIPENIAQVLSQKEERKNKNTQQNRPKDRYLPPMEVDLHIHQLVPKSKGMSNYDMLTIQMDTAKRQLDFAIQKKIQRVVFIHGIGEGVLRTELEFLFKNYSNIQINDADFQKYGRGATEVYIFQSKTS